MCGIAGILSPAPARPRHELLRAMVATLAHRGPDDSGIWEDAQAGIGLGHARLSILDLSPLGHQPMHSACGRHSIVFNGEIYNHLELRQELAGYPFRSTSDTETILAAVGAWGLGPAIAKFVGMFAFALWDREERRLYLVRDQVGIKPLYYGKTTDGGWLFGSELKALRAHPGYAPSIDRGTLALYFRHSNIPAPHCIYTDTWKVEPGQLVVLGADGIQREKWWDVGTVWRSGFNSPLELSEAEAVDRLELLLKDAVQKQMLSDVPLGAFLSGGYDSSTVVALMQAQSNRPVRTFSIGFHEDNFNEAGYAKAVARHLGTDHTELYVTPQDMLNVVPSIAHHWDEPFADSSQIPTYILSKLTRESVTVALSGDGGDELFSGYQRYFYARKWDTLAMLPLPIRRWIKHLLQVAPDFIFTLLGSIGPKFRWRMDLLDMREFREFYRFLLSHFKHPDTFVLGAREPQTALTVEQVELPDKYAQMALWDLQQYLPDDILTKVDRASMASSLEARVPLLDHRVVEFAARIPMSMKVRQGQGKWLLRQLLYRYVPRELVERPKMGFGVPVERWLRNELRQWCTDLLSPSAIRRQGLLDADMVERMWREYLAGEGNWSYYLWDVLMFQAWLESSPQ